MKRAATGELSARPSKPHMLTNDVLYGTDGAYSFDQFFPLYPTGYSFRTSGPSSFEKRLTASSDCFILVSPVRYTSNIAQWKRK